MKEYQGTRLGRRNGDSCLLELLPLPSRSSDRWLYKDLSAIPHLKYREAYLEHYAPLRAAHLKLRVEQYAPRAVFFYGSSSWSRRRWETIADGRIERIDSTQPYAVARAGTVFVIVKHPAAHGVKSDFFFARGSW